MAKILKQIKISETGARQVVMLIGFKRGGYAVIDDFNLCKRFSKKPEAELFFDTFKKGKEGQMAKGKFRKLRQMKRVMGKKLVSPVDMGGFIEKNFGSTRDFNKK